MFRFEADMVSVRARDRRMQTVFQSVLPPEQRSIGFQPVRRARVPAKRVRAFAWIHKQDAYPTICEGGNIDSGAEPR
jgi:hypothetical protein